MATDAAIHDESRSPHEIFRMLDEEHCRDVVARALQQRKTAASDARKQLNQNLRGLRIPGFRDASRAPRHKLLDPALDALERGHDPLARAVLAVWMDSLDALQQAAAAHLAKRGIQTPDAGDGCFPFSWTVEEWRRERDAMIAADDKLDTEDAGLMLCLVSRRFPAPPALSSPLFGIWMDDLWALPPDAPDWEETDTFAKWVRHVARAKHRELFRWRVLEIGGICKDIRGRFDDDLRYLDVDPDPWPKAVEERPSLAARTLELARNLRDALTAYQPLRPQAESREEERRRSVERGQREEDVIRLVAEYRKLLAEPDPAAEPAPEAVGPAGAPAVDAPADPVVADLQAEIMSLQTDQQQIQQEFAPLRAELERLREENRKLLSEQAKRDGEIKRLAGELAESRRGEELWRRAYVDEKRKPRALADDEPITVGSVREAIAQAQETFPDRLLIKLNAKSNEDTPFKSPDEVFDILALLATADRRVLGEQIGKIYAGWFYRANQSVTTMGENKKWYETRVEGTTWKLANHVGKGSSHDPRHTIRIAFAWDETQDRVIVGFIGLHQRNRQS